MLLSKKIVVSLVQQIQLSVSKSESKQNLAQLSQVAKLAIAGLHKATEPQVSEARRFLQVRFLS